LTKDAVFDTFETRLPLTTAHNFLQYDDLRRLHMKKYVLAVLLVLVMAVPAMAKTDITFPSTFTQDQFKSFSADMGMAISYQALSPAAPLGGTLPGFDAGVEASVVKLDKSASYYSSIKSAVTASGKDFPNSLVFPRVHVQVGFPVIPVDLGVSYTSVPNSEIKLVGYEIKYAVIKGGLVMPAVAIRGAYTKLSGLKELDLSTKSLDLSISKGILIFTPYAGIGEVWITSQAHTGTPLIPLETENITKSKFFVGTKVKVFPFVNLVVQGDFSNVKEYSARLNVNF
jgi:hypothetical protein